MHLEAVHLQAALVVDVHILLLGRREKLLVVEEGHVAHRFPHLRSTIACLGSCIVLKVTLHNQQPPAQLAYNLLLILLYLPCSRTARHMTITSEQCHDGHGQMKASASVITWCRAIEHTTQQQQSQG